MSKVPTNMLGLLETPLQLRDELWETQFLKAMTQSRFNILQNELQEGPEGFPYLLVETAEDGSETFEQVMQWVYKTGVGMVVNPMDDVPDYVLTFGMIWNFVHFGQFVSAPLDVHIENGAFQMRSGDQVVTSDASNEYLPTHVRHLVREFLGQQQLKTPRILVVKNRNHADFCFSQESLGLFTPADQKVFLEALSWFFPNNYSLAIVPEQGLPPFFAL